MAGLSLLKPGQALESQGLDLLYRWRPASPAPPELLIVGIDEPSFQEIGLPWPWPRRLHAQLVRRLSAAGAALIVFDVIFADPTTPEDDELLAATIREAGNVILPRTLSITQDPQFSRQILVQPLESLRRAARNLGLSMITPDPDGVVRHFRLQLGGMETLAGVAARSFRPQLTFPRDLSGLINYAGPHRSLDTVSYYQVVDEDRPLPEARIRGRIVLVGRMLEASATPQAQADAFLTPFFAGGGQLMAGVEIQGHIIHTLIKGTWGRELPKVLLFCLYLLVILFFSHLLERLSPVAGLGVLAGLVLLILAGSAYLFWWWGLWVPPLLLSGGLVLIYSGNVLGEYLLEAREKRWLRQAFGRYVSPLVVADITAHPERLELGGVEADATVVFSDLENFTTLSENLAPQELIGLLNEYFTPMTQIVLEHRGTLDKFIGDAVMAFWGAPVPFSDHAFRACDAALAMAAAVQPLQRTWQARGLPALKARVGIHSGPVVVGNVGSRERFNYTALGDTVNLAARLEGVNKIYGTAILLSEATHRLAGEFFEVRELDLIQVKGRHHPVTVYELLGRCEGKGLDWLEVFAAGREAYQRRDWARAEKHFQKVLRLKPEDGPARVFLDRCRRFQQQPPPPEWEGVFVLESK